MDKFERISRDLVHKGKIIEYYEDTLKVPNGNIVKYDFIGHKGAAAVVPVTEDGKILMVRQYRNALDRETLEIPAGGLNSISEPTKDAAARELNEETGYASDNLEFLISIRTTVAFCNEKIDVYVANNLKKSCQNLDEDEFLEVDAIPFAKAIEMVNNGEIIDGKTQLAILKVKELLGK